MCCYGAWCMQYATSLTTASGDRGSPSCPSPASMACCILRQLVLIEAMSLLMSCSWRCVWLMWLHQYWHCQQVAGFALKPHPDGLLKWWDQGPLHILSVFSHQNLRRDRVSTSWSMWMEIVYYNNIMSSLYMNQVGSNLWFSYTVI